MHLRLLRRSLDIALGRLSASLWLVLSVSLLATACGAERYIIIGTAQAPSACGFVELNDKTDKTTKLKVHLEQLHPVDSLDPSLHAYVVWFESGKDAAVRAGALKYKPEDRLGELTAVSPYRKFIVKVTAEANDTPSVPSAFVVASEEISTLD